MKKSRVFLSILGDIKKDMDMDEEAADLFQQLAKKMIEQAGK